MSGTTVLVLSGAVPGAVSSQRPATTATSLVFDRVTIVDVVRGKLLPAQRLVITGTRIQAVGDMGAVKVPKGAQVVDARGKYLIPGLWDMHGHVFSYPDIMYPLFVAYGVTGVRELGQRGRFFGADSFRLWQREIAAGTRVGPRVPGPSFDLDFGDCTVDIPTWDSRTTPDQARRVVDTIRAAGFAFIKVHGGGTRTTYFAMAAEARRRRIPFAGHLPEYVTPIEASDSGQRSFEHMNVPMAPCTLWHDSTVTKSETEIERECAALADRLVRNGTWFIPTLGILSAERAPDSSFVVKMSPITQDRGRLMHRVGIPMLAGTDVNDLFGLHQFLTPGISLHDELALFVQIGMTPLEALRTATINPAQYWRATDSLGTVESGKLADLVLLDADPLVDIHNTTRIHAVVANGRYFHRAALDILLAEMMPRWKNIKPPMTGFGSFCRAP